MAMSIHSSLSCLLPFYTIPIFPLFKSKDFSFTCNPYSYHTQHYDNYCIAGNLRHHVLVAAHTYEMNSYVGVKILTFKNFPLYGIPAV